MHGEIISDWKRAGGRLTWTIRIPANTSARVWVPSEPGTDGDGKRRAVEKAKGLRVVGREGKFFISEAGAGSYTFASRMARLNNPIESFP